MLDVVAHLELYNRNFSAGRIWEENREPVPRRRLQVPLLRSDPPYALPPDRTPKKFRAKFISLMRSKYKIEKVHGTLRAVADKVREERRGSKLPVTPLMRILMDEWIQAAAAAKA